MEILCFPAGLSETGHVYYAHGRRRTKGDLQVAAIFPLILLSTKNPSLTIIVNLGFLCYNYLLSLQACPVLCKYAFASFSVN